MTTATPVVTLTDNAIAKIKEFFAQDKDLAGKALRVVVESGGCSGYSYGFKFDDAKPEDATQTYDSFSIVIDAESQKLLKDATIDYKEEFGSEGFSIKNPQAKSSCGCGNSFEA
jgi:iron-sulfur cluster insertion protein